MGQHYHGSVDSTLSYWNISTARCVEINYSLTTFSAQDLTVLSLHALLSTVPLSKAGLPATSQDLQCAVNSSGVLCSQCASDLSLLSSNRCKECINFMLILTIPFTPAGAGLVCLHALHISFHGVSGNLHTNHFLSQYCHRLSLILGAYLS